MTNPGGFRDDSTGRFRLRIHYADAEHKASLEAERHGYPCAEGCAWCCRSVVMVTDGDVAIMREGLRLLSAEKRLELKQRADAFADLFGPWSKRGIKDHPFASIEALAVHWPAGGLACPALEEKEPGKGTCAIYRHRPLACRTHYARGRQCQSPAGCKPGGKDAAEVEILDASPMKQRIVNENELSLVGLLGLELADLLDLERD